MPNDLIHDCAHILVLEVLQQFQFTVSALGQDWRRERLHDLLDRHGLSGELVLCGTD